MDIDVYPPRELGTVLRVLRSALNPDEALNPQERRFLQAYAAISGYPQPSTDPQPIAASEVAIEGAHQRKRLVQLGGLAVLLGNPVRPLSVAFLTELAAHLGVNDSVVQVTQALAQGRRLRARMIAVRRAFRVMLKEAYTAEGTLGVLRFLGAMFLKFTVNRDRHWDFKRLGLLPQGTLGREYWAHITQLGFGFPGEPGGIPDSVVYHDICHVLADHSTEPEGEIQQGSFQAGNRREDGFFFVQFVVLQFHHGIRITPVAPPHVGNFDPAKVLWAIHRGARCNVDMTHQWDFWPLMGLPLEEARERCGLLPRTPDWAL